MPQYPTAGDATDSDTARVMVHYEVSYYYCYCSVSVCHSDKKYKIRFHAFEHRCTDEHMA